MFIVVNQGFDEDKKRLVELFCLCAENARFYWLKVIKFLGKVIKFLGKKASSLLNSLLYYCKNHPWIIMSWGYAIFALFIMNKLIKKYGKKFRWYNFLILIIIYLIIIWLLGVAMKTEVFQAILKLLKRTLFKFKTILTLRDLKKSLAEHSDYSLAEDAKNNKNDFKNFMIFSIFTIVITKFLYQRFKRKLVGEGPLTDIVIEIIDLDPLNVDNFSELPELLILN
nr:hypothetical protein [Naviculales sp.]WPV76571.1 hypothetical protein [Naviculales sp.]